MAWWRIGAKTYLNWCWPNSMTHICSNRWRWVNTLRTRQHGRDLADAIFKGIFLNENVWILIKISLKLIPRGPINNIQALVQLMAWCRSGNKPLSEPMMVSLLMHICVTWPQWVNYRYAEYFWENIFAFHTIPWLLNSLRMSSNTKIIFQNMGISIIKIRWSWYSLIFVRQYLYTKMSKSPGHQQP